MGINVLKRVAKELGENLTDEELQGPTGYTLYKDILLNDVLFVSGDD